MPLSVAFVFGLAVSCRSKGPGVNASADPIKIDTGYVSGNMMAMWTQFARTGNPNVEGLITRPAYELATDQYLYIAEPLQVKSGFSKVAQKK
jgi:para-nitrobenzyl esterase